VVRGLSPRAAFFASPPRLEYRSETAENLK
jgi:hypothetical protein